MYRTPCRSNEHTVGGGTSVRSGEPPAVSVSSSAAEAISRAALAEAVASREKAEAESVEVIKRSL